MGVEPGLLPTEIAISALTLAELVAGPSAATDDLQRRRRQDRLERFEVGVEALPFDLRCARAYGLIYSAVVRLGRKARGSRATDLMIAATALAHDLPLYTLNPEDLRGLEGLLGIIDLSA
jgi:predicted nucleic acid-binding protein